MKKLITVQDISCIGKCSCTAALPIISSYGIETLILPTALLSAHTDGFGENTFLDLTDEMKRIISHWRTLDLRPDGIYTGYLGSRAQLSIVSDFIREFKTDNTRVVVDPVMGDGGRYYKYFGDGYLEDMKKLCGYADIITPNITEACLLTDEQFSFNCPQRKLTRIVKRLLSLGAKSVVITGIHFGDDEIGYAFFDGDSIKTIREPLRKNIRFAGTGDVFSSSLSSEIVCGKPFFDAVASAAAFTEKCIDATDDKTKDFYYGLDFEKVIGKERK